MNTYEESSVKQRLHKHCLLWLGVLVFLSLLSTIPLYAENQAISNYTIISKEVVGYFTKYTVMVPMKDSVKLETDIYIPRIGKSPWPVLLTRTPYARTGIPYDLGNNIGDNSTLDIFNNPKSVNYVIVFQSVRGRYGSQGSGILFINDAWGELSGTTKDGAYMINWLLKQPWCNGKIGTFGTSAPGYFENLLAGATHEGVSAQFISVGPECWYKDGIYLGGAYHKEDTETWLDGGLGHHEPFDPINLSIWQNRPSYDKFWKSIDASIRHNFINIPAIFRGGWFDVVSRSTINAFCGRQYNGDDGARGKQILVMGPWTHGGWKTRQQGELIFPENSAMPPELNAGPLFDYYLRGINNGFDQLSSVYYYVMGDVDDLNAPGNEWRTADNWPIPAQNIPCYFLPNGVLRADINFDYDGEISYISDPINPPESIGGLHLYDKGPMDQRSVEFRDDVITFTSPMLQQPHEVTGHIKVILYASSDCVDTDFVTKLCDVYPDGRSILISEGVLRARYRNCFYKPELLEPNKIYKFEIELAPTSIIFNSGHMIRVSIQSASYPAIDANPNTGKNSWKETMPKKATNTIYYSKKGEPSCIILPIVK